MRRYVRKRSNLRFCDAKPSESVIVGSRHGGVGHTPRYPKLSDVAGARWGAQSHFHERCDEGENSPLGLIRVRPCRDRRMGSN